MRTTGRTGRSHTWHCAVAQQAKALPGQWVPASEHNTSWTARAVARAITKGQWATAYLDGRYEADVRPSELRSRVWVRYLGPIEEANSQ